MGDRDGVESVVDVSFFRRLILPLLEDVPIPVRAFEADETAAFKAVAMSLAYAI